MTIKYDPSIGPFRLPKSLPCKASKSFTTALRPDAFAKNALWHLELESCNQDIFDIFLNWLIADVTKDESGESSNNGHFTRILEVHRSSSYLEIQTWCFADRYLMPRLQNVIMSSLLHRYLTLKEPMDIDDLCYAVDCSSPHSKLRAAMYAIAKVTAIGWPHPDSESNFGRMLDDMEECSRDKDYLKYDSEISPKGDQRWEGKAWVGFDIRLQDFLVPEIEHQHAIEE